MTVYSLDILLPDLEPVCCSMSNSNCYFLTWIQILSGGRSGGLVFPSLEELSTVCCDPHKGFGIVNKADVFLKLSCFFDDPMDIGNLISGSC